jgi:toxin FitB
VSGFLMDTCAISEAISRHPNRGLAAWLRGVDPVQVYISVVTLGEIRKGIERCDAGVKKARLEAWFTNEVAQQFAGRVLSFDADVADRWGRMVAALQRDGTNPAAIDSLIAATALHHNLSVITRNEKDFKPLRVSVTNPWSAT